MTRVRSAEQFDPDPYFAIVDRAGIYDATIDIPLVERSPDDKCPGLRRRARDPTCVVRPRGPSRAVLMFGTLMFASPRADDRSMLRHGDTPSGERAGHTAPSALRGLEVGELLQAITALHLDGLLTDAEYRSKRRRLAAQL